MSSSIDFPVDAVLTDFMHQLQPDSVLDACRQQLCAGLTQPDYKWQHVRAIEALYHPGRYVRVAYAFVKDSSVPDHRVWPQGDIVYVHAPVRSPMSRRGVVMRVSGMDLEAYRFPSDRRLRGLRKFAGRESACAIWQKWIDLSGVQERLAPETLQRFLLRYVPEQKWVVRLRAEPTPNPGDHKRRITVRSAAPAVCGRLLKRHEDLRRWSKGSQGCLHAARVVGYEPQLGLLAIKWAHGEHLLDRLAVSGPTDVFKDFAHVIRSLHSAPVRDLPSLTKAGLLRQAGEAADDLTATCPELSVRLKTLRNRLDTELPRVEDSSATLHNDLHWNQVRIDRERFTVLDLERMAKGDPLIDVANLVAQLRMIGVRPEFAVDRDTACNWANEFVEQWQLLSGRRVDFASFRCYVVFSLLRLARGIMRHLRPGWRVVAHACIELAEAELSAPLARR